MLVRAVLIAALLAASWWGMQAVHEAGHVLGAVASGGRVERVVFNPLEISRTDLAENPHPQFVAWAGPVFGSVVPVVAWLLARGWRARGAFLLRFFAGFCLVANGLYLGLGSFGGIGDAGDLVRHGAPMWTLWLFGVVTVPIGLGLWHGLGPRFGLGRTRGEPGAI